MITKADAKSAAEKGLIEALKCSIEHHKDPRRMSSLELQIATENKSFEIYTENCALCVFYKRFTKGTKGCSECPLKSCGADSLWNESYSALEKFNDDPSNANHTAFLEAEEKMVDRLELELRFAQEKVIGEHLAKSKAEEVTYSIGDRFMHPYGGKTILMSTGNTGNGVIMSCLKDGCHWNGPKEVKKTREITKAEFDKHWGQNYNYVRYWDNQKKRYTGDRK